MEVAAELPTVDDGSTSASAPLAPFWVSTLLFRALLPFSELSSILKYAAESTLQPLASAREDFKVNPELAQPIADLFSAWQLETEKKYQHTIEPLAFAEKDGTTVATARVTGNFPGSPVDLQLIFTVEAGKIRCLEIK